MMSSDSGDTYIPVSCFSSFNTLIILSTTRSNIIFLCLWLVVAMYTQASEEEGPHQCSILCILSIKMSSPCVLNPSTGRNQEA